MFENANGFRGALAQQPDVHTESLEYQYWNKTKMFQAIRRKLIHSLAFKVSSVREVAGAVTDVR